ncbi:MAG: hypothetical protein R3E97_19960 [Candidatus Eisenbacteria bacterium]
MIAPPDVLDTERLQHAAQMPMSLDGRRFYHPGIIATYSVLSLPVGMYLYGLNVARRGSRVMGRTMTIVAGLVLLGMFVNAAAGGPPLRTGALGIFVGIAMIRLESSTYRYAVAHGGTRARWWPPLLWVIGIGVLLALVVPLLI